MNELSDASRALVERARQQSPALGPEASLALAMRKRTRRRQRRRAAVTGSALVIAAAVALGWVGTGDEPSLAKQDPGPTAVPVSPADAPDALDAPAESEGIRALAAGQSMEWGEARVVAGTGGARVRRRDDRLELEAGRLETQGEVTIESGACTVCIRGRGQVSRDEIRFTTARVFVGTIEVLAGESYCHIEDLEAPSAEPEASARGRTSPRERPDAVEAEIRAYERAARLRRRDDRGALRQWRSMRRRWPNGVMAHEVDLDIVDALVRLDRQPAARREARRFLARHPTSPHALRMRRLADESPAPNE